MSEDAHDVPELDRNTDYFNKVSSLVQRRQTEPSGVVPVQGTPLPLCPHNIDMNTHRGKALMLKAGSPGTIDMPDAGTLKMVCHNYIIIPDSQIDEKTGELKEFARCVFFDARGETFRTTAAHGPYRLKALCDMYTDEDWQRGIPLVISVRKSKRGTTYHDIQIDIEAL